MSLYFCPQEGSLISDRKTRAPRCTVPAGPRTKPGPPATGCNTLDWRVPVSTAGGLATLLTANLASAGRDYKYDR